MSFVDVISSKHKKEFASLSRKQRKRTLRAVLLVIALFCFIYLLITPAFDTDKLPQSLEQSALELIQANPEKGGAIVEDHLKHERWLSQHGYPFEVDAYNNLSLIIIRSLRWSIRTFELHPGSTPSALFFALSGALLRISFIVFACWRIWIVAIGAAFFYSARAKKSYVAENLLGQTGNGRLFFSGIRATLEGLKSNGSPSKQLRGLACPATVSVQVAKSSDLVKVLEEYSALNDTNLSLAQIILHYSNLPAFIGEQEESLLKNFYDTETKLPDNTYNIVRAALKLHAAYAAKSNPSTTKFENVSPDLESAGSIQKVKASQYGEILEGAFDRVLTPTLRSEMTAIPAAHLVTALLAYEAGKVMTYSYEGERWIVKSRFGELNARAVLHSIPSFTKEYSYEERTIIRRALIYASRESVHGTVRFPVDLSLKTRALRQWVEILMSLPHRLQACADEIELFGLISEAHAAWSEILLTREINVVSKALEKAITTPANIMFLPLKVVVSIMRQAVPMQTIKRLEELLFLVSHREKLSSLAKEVSEANYDRDKASPKVLEPISFNELKELSKRHEVSVEDLKDWSALRVVLNSFGWLGRRVGDLTVPENGVIFVVFDMPEGVPGRNELGLIGQKGMVALRSSRLEGRWGKNWRSRFLEARSAKMAETTEDFEKLLKGVHEVLPEDNDGVMAL